MAATGETVAQKQPERPKSSLQERFGKMLQVSTKMMEPAASLSGMRMEGTPKAEGKTPTGRHSEPSTRATSSSPRSISQITNFDELYILGREVMPSTHSYMKVHFATRKSDHVEVVVKLRFKPKCFRSKEDERNWRRSTEYLLNMPDSTHIARIYDVFEDPKTFFIVMEKVSGMDLFEAIEREDMTVQQGKEIVRQLLGAMVHLHSHNAVHKDLKLENVMVDSPKGKSAMSPKQASPKCRPLDNFCLEAPPQSPTVVKLIDFDTVETFSLENRARSVVGTDQYIAQEAYAGHYSPASDIFSVGVIAYRLICGKFPFAKAMFDDKPGENWVGSPKMKQIQNRLKEFQINFKIAPWPAEAKARELTRWMLQTDGKDRPTAKQALEHPFFEVTGQTPAIPQGPWGSRPQRQN